jgi:cell division protein DivIC
MKINSKYLKNKYYIALAIFFVYILFLDDVDIFAIVSQNKKLAKIQNQQEETSKKLKELRHTLHDLHFGSEMEAYAREHKLFKKDDEDIFVISYE